MVRRENIFLVVLLKTLCALTIDLSHPVILYREKSLVNKCIKTILKEHYYYKKMIKRLFNKNLAMATKGMLRQYCLPKEKIK